MSSPASSLVARHGADLPPGTRRAALAAIILHMTAVGVTMGIMYPLPGLVLEPRGIETWVIGLIAGTPAAGILVLVPVAPRLAGRFGPFPTMLAGLAVGCTAFVLTPLVDDLWAWAVLRFFMGAGLGLPWLLGETWINALSLESSRGRVLALYAAGLFLGFAGGPIALDLVGVEGFAPYLVGAGALALAALPLVPVRRFAPPLPARPKTEVLTVAKAAPTVAAAGLLAGFCESAAYALVPLYGLRSGMDQSAALGLLTAVILGGIVLQYPIGWLADRMARRLLLALLALAGAVVALLWPLVMDAYPAALAVGVVIGGLVLSYYSIGLALLGQRFALEDLAVANAAFILCYELGTLTGPAVAGAAMDLWRHGLPATIALASLLFSALAFSRWRTAEDERRETSVVD
jgi:MFS family permease